MHIRHCFSELGDFTTALGILMSKECFILHGRWVTAPADLWGVVQCILQDRTPKARSLSLLSMSQPLAEGRGLFGACRALHWEIWSRGFLLGHGEIAKEQLRWSQFPRDQVVSVDRNLGFCRAWVYPALKSSTVCSNLSLQNSSQKTWRRLICLGLFHFFQLIWLL